MQTRSGKTVPMTIALRPPAQAPRPALPAGRGPLSQWVLEVFARGPIDRVPSVSVADALVDDDLHLALHLLYELHYRSFDGVDDDLEWNPVLLGFRADLERTFETALRAELARPSDANPRELNATTIGAEITAAIEESAGRSLSRFTAETATPEQVRELAIHRSIYQLREADPHTWAIPRLQGAAKAAMVLIQGDEYGWGHQRAMHATLFGDTMRALELDDTYGRYLDLVPGPTLATDNLVTLFGLHRRLRGALVGHLATFEMTSVVPMSRYSKALERLGFDADARSFYDVHVVADAQHELVARDELVPCFIRDEPDQAQSVLFGVRAVLEVERRFSNHVLDAWEAGRSSLRPW
jgi:hypothetical protein